MRTLGSYICCLEVEEVELRVLRRTGGAAVFVISYMHVHRCRIKKHAFVVCLHECGHICQVSGVQSCKGQKCGVLVEWTWLKTDVWDTTASGVMRGPPAFKARLSITLLIRQPGCLRCITIYNTSNNHMILLESEIKDILWSWSDACNKYWRDSDLPRAHIC